MTGYGLDCEFTLSANSGSSLLLLKFEIDRRPARA